MKGIRHGLIALSAALALGTGALISTHVASAQASTRMAVTMNEYSFILETAAVPAGDITFDVVNTGEEIHEMILFKSDMDIKSLPKSASNPGEVDEDKIGEYIGGFEDVQTGTAASGTLVLAPGTYILLCNLNKHYENGMVANLTVN